MKILIVRAALSLGLVLVAQCAASAAFVVTEDFESSTPSPYTWSQQNSNPALATDSDPATTTGVVDSTQTGDWFAYRKSAAPDIDVQVTNNATPGAAQGSNYLRLRRSDQNVDIAMGFAFRPWDNPVTGGVVTASWKMYIPLLPPNIGAAAGMWFTSAANNNNNFGLNAASPVLFSFNPLSNPDHLRYSENSFANNIYLSSPKITTGVWQDWVLTTDLNAGQTTISINGVASGSFPHNTPTNQASLLVFQGAQGGAEYYVDDLRISYVPEPATFGIMAFGAALMALRRR